MILFDLALMLLAPDVAEAMNVGTGAHFTLVTKAVAPFKPIAGPEAVSSSGDSRHLYSQTTQALPVQPADNRRPAKLAEDSAVLESRLACAIGMRARHCHDSRWHGNAQDAGCRNTRSAMLPPRLLASSGRRRRAGAKQTGLSAAWCSLPLRPFSS